MTRLPSGGEDLQRLCGLFERAATEIIGVSRSSPSMNWPTSGGMPIRGRMLSQFEPRFRS
ncbi:hypothetical protein [Streptomyces monomycini]|uniref:hypothetical protein n=1 Tax=Streptomyces monomycini TaxID=371720 RepID=UPI001EECF216|nr:hypothetical protein [Streptomyces monomycini]